MAEMKTFGLFVSWYQIDDEELDIFFCLIFEYLDKDNNDVPTGIVYIATGCRSNLGSLMLCILNYFLCFQEHSTTLFISTALDNDEWYSTQGFMSVDEDNKFDNDNPNIPKALVTQIFQYCVCHNYLDETNGLQYDQDGEECDYFVFKILQGMHLNNKY